MPRPLTLVRQLDARVALHAFDYAIVDDFLFDVPDGTDREHVHSTAEQDIAEGKERFASLFTPTWYGIISEADAIELFVSEADRDALLTHYHDIEFDAKAIDFDAPTIEAAAFDAQAQYPELHVSTMPPDYRYRPTLREAMLSAYDAAHDHTMLQSEIDSAMEDAIMHPGYLDSTMDDVYAAFKADPSHENYEMIRAALDIHRWYLAQ